MEMLDPRIENAAASVIMEGMVVTEADKDLARKCVRGEITYQDAIDSIISKYRKPQNK